MTEQYGALRQLKTILPSDHVICHMDFAENYVCSQADEVQSAYFDKAAVTLHTMVVYYKIGGQLQHKSFIMVSEWKKLDAATVYTFVDELIWVIP